MRRRLLLGAAVTLPGCGFGLKRAPELSFKTIRLAGFPARSQLAVELRSQLEASPTTRVVEGASEAQVILQAISETRERIVVAQTAANDNDWDGAGAGTLAAGLGGTLELRDDAAVDEVDPLAVCVEAGFGPAKAGPH